MADMDTAGELTGAQSLVKSLEKVGAETVFGIPGGAILPARSTRRAGARRPASSRCRGGRRLGRGRCPHRRGRCFLFVRAQPR